MNNNSNNESNPNNQNTTNTPNNIKNSNNTNQIQQNNLNSIEPSERQIKKQETNEASQAAAHTAGKAAATYLGGGVGNQVYDKLSQTKAGQGIEKMAGKAIQRTPGTNKAALRKLNENGVYDKLNQATDTVGGKKAGGKTPTSGTGKQPANKFKNNTPKNISKGNVKSTGQKKDYRQNFQNHINNRIDSSKQKELNDINNSEAIQEESIAKEFARKQVEKQKAKVKAEAKKKIIQVIISNPPLLIALGFVAIFFVIFFILILFVAMDADFVGTGISKYEEAEVIPNKCDSIILVLENDNYEGPSVASIEDVDLTEMFEYGPTPKKRENRWTYDTYLLDEYVKGVVYAEAREVKDELTFEVAAIAARTYTLTIASSKCYIFSNENKNYSNPQQFQKLSTGMESQAEITAAVNNTKKTVITLNDNLYNHSANSYYDYFCYKEKTMNDEGEFYKMLQVNEEERLLIHESFKKENVPDSVVQKNCQENGMSLFGAKQLLNKKTSPYSTFRVLKYYYGYNIKFKRVGETSSAASGGCLYWPVGSDETTTVDGVVMAEGTPATTKVTSQFGKRVAPTAGASTQHNAIDIGGGTDGVTNIIAADNGTVTVAGVGGGCGNWIKIDHGNMVTRYCHLNSIAVSEGQSVKKGQVIGKMGTTGVSTGVHLDFQITVNGTPVDPLNYISVEDPRATTCVYLSGGAINTGDGPQSVCLTLKNRGYSNEAIAGVLTNLWHESNDFNPKAVNSIGCVGIVQWCYGRKDALKSISNYDTLEVQINYMLSELDGKYKISTDNKMLEAGGTAQSKTKIWCDNYEVPGESHCLKRYNNTEAQNNYLQFAANNCQ